jgi:hypothetical protein
MSFGAGDTFLCEGLGSKKHLFVVLCEPFGDPPFILTVPLNTLTINTDTTVVLSPGDHPFVVRATAVSYDLMSSMPVNQLLELEKLNRRSVGDSFRRHQPINPELLERIVEGVFRSDLTPKRMVREMAERLGRVDLS